jgi:hypothetical protein
MSDSNDIGLRKRATDRDNNDNTYSGNDKANANTSLTSSKGKGASTLGSNIGNVVGGWSIRQTFVILLIPRLLAAVVSPILDCDGTTPSLPAIISHRYITMNDNMMIMNRNLQLLGTITLGTQWSRSTNMGIQVLLCPLLFMNDSLYHPPITTSLCIC